MTEEQRTEANQKRQNESYDKAADVEKLRARQKALDSASFITSKNAMAYSTESVLLEADKIYCWLTQDSK